MDGLEDDLDGQATVLRIDMLSDVGRESARVYGIKAVPTTLLFDGNGQVIARQTGPPDKDEIRALVADLQTQPAP